MEEPSASSSLHFLQRFENEGIACLVSDLDNPLFMPPVLFVCTCLLLSQPLLIAAQIFTMAVICYTILPFALTIYLRPALSPT